MILPVSSPNCQA